MTIFHFLDFLGTAVFAISGAYAGARKGMDIFGVLLLAFIVGNGGGTVRDILLDNGPVFWMSQHSYIWISFISGIVALIFARFFIPPYRLLLIADAIGLGVFAVIGMQKTLMAGGSSTIAIMMGILTGTGGGIIRDVICNEIPLFLRKEIYVFAAFLGALIFIITKKWLTLDLAIAGSIATTVIIRISAIYYDLTLPAFSEHWFHEARLLAKKENLND